MFQIVNPSLLRGTAPEIPIDFTVETLVLERNVNENYVVSDRWSQHLFGYHVDFEPYKHVYIVNGQYMSYSVTQVLEFFFGTFDADETIMKMKNSSSQIWPRLEYSFLTASGEYEPFSDEQIKLKWALDRNRGTWMHYNIERYLNGLHYSSDVDYEMDLFIKFYENEILGRGLSSYITEWRIASPKALGLAGSVDFVGRFDDGTFGIVDWKRIKHWDSIYSNFSKQCIGVLSELGASNYNKYSLQVNLYKYILELEYGIKISWMAVASFHPNQGEYKFAVIENMDDIVAKIVLFLNCH